MDEQKYWDPLYQEINKDQYKQDCEKMNKKFFEFKQYPNKFKNTKRKILLVNLLITLSCIGGVILLHIYYPEFIKNREPYFLLPLWLWIIVPIYNRYTRTTQHDIIKMEIARKNHWLYAPNFDRERGKLFYNSFKLAFEDKHVINPYFDDQFWGSFEEKGKKTPFWTALLNYYITGGRNKKSVQKVITIFEMEHKSIMNLALYPQKFTHKLIGKFRKKDIETQNDEFNKAFTVFYEECREEKINEVLQILNPEVQNDLLTLKEKYNDLVIVIHRNKLIIIFGSKWSFLKDMKTNFFKYPQINQEDIDTFNARIKELFSISSKIIQQLD